MFRELIEATGVYRNGRWDKARLLLAGVPFLLFVLWRLSSHGVYGADDVLQAIERDLLADYKAEQYRKAGLLEPDPSAKPADLVVAQELDGLTVRITNVSMSGSLFGWSGNDPIGVRFDYAIEQDGVVKAQDRNVYRCTHRQTRTALWECNAISYYLRYL